MIPLRALKPRTVCRPDLPPPALGRQGSSLRALTCAEDLKLSGLVSLVFLAFNLYAIRRMIEIATARRTATMRRNRSKVTS